MPSAGKHTTGAKRGKKCNKCQVLENTNVSFDWLIVQKLFNKHKMNSNSKHFFSRWLDMSSDKFLPHWNMLTWWLSPSNNSLGLLFRPCKTNVAVSKWGPQKKQSRRIIVLRLLSIQKQFSIKNRCKPVKRTIPVSTLLAYLLRNASRQELVKKTLGGSGWVKRTSMEVLASASPRAWKPSHAWDLYCVCAYVRVYALIPKAPLELGTDQKPNCSCVHILGL